MMKLCCIVFGLVVASWNACFGGTIEHQIDHKSIGDSVEIKSVLVDKIVNSPPYIVVRDPANDTDRIIVLLEEIPSLKRWQPVNIAGLLTRTSTGELAIRAQRVDIFLDPDGHAIATPLPPQHALLPTEVVIEPNQPNVGAMSEPQQPAPPNSAPPTVDPQHTCNSIQDALLVPDGQTIQLECLKVQDVGEDASYGSYLLLGDATSVDGVRAYSTSICSANDRVALVTGTMATDQNDVRVICVNSGPGVPPQGFEGRLLIAPLSSIAGVKTLPDSTPEAPVMASVQGCLVSAVFSDENAFYIQVVDKPLGLRVENLNGVSQMAVGDIVDVIGEVKTTSAQERFLDVTQSGGTTSSSANAAGDVPVLDLGSESPRIFNMRNSSVGGGSNMGQQGPRNGVGLNNVGLLVRTTGRVIEAGSVASGRHFYISDGSLLPESASSLAPTAIRVVNPTATYVPTVGDYIAVTGIVSLTNDTPAILPDTGTPAKKLTPRSGADIEVVEYSGNSVTPGFNAVDIVGNVKVTWTYSGAYDHAEAFYRIGSTSPWLKHNLAPVPPSAASDYRLWGLPISPLGQTLQFYVTIYPTSSGPGQDSNILNHQLNNPIPLLGNWATDTTYLSTNELGSVYNPKY